MATRFVFGRAGSGKTHHCIEQMVAAAVADPLGPPIFYVVPKQATFAAQRRLALDDRLNGFCRIRVVSFELLAEAILVEAGGDAVPAVTPRGRRMILTRLLRAHADQLRLYTSAAGRIGLAEELDATFRTLENAGHDADSLQATIEALAAENPPVDSPAATLVNKLHDVRLIFDAYHAFIGQDRIDPHVRLLQVCQAVRSTPFMRRAMLFVDGFLDFNAFERKLMVSLAGTCAELTITILIDPRCPTIANPHVLASAFDLFHRTAGAYRKLHFALTEADIAPAAPILLTRRIENEPAVLRDVEANAFQKSRPVPRGAAVQLIQAMNRRGEVEAAAGLIRAWLRGGLRPRDILVLSRSPTDYADLIESTFAEHAIPFFADRRRPATHHPLVQAVQSLCHAARSFGHESIITLAKSGLVGLSAEEADELENYVLAHNIRGAGWAPGEPWKFAARDDGDDAAIPADVTEAFRKRLVMPLMPLRAILATDEPRPLREFAAAVMQAIVDFGVHLRIASRIERFEKVEAFERSAEDQQVWAELVSLVDEMVDLLGDDSFLPAEFIELLESGLSGFDLAIAPATLDQVIVGEVERTRYERFRGVILLGLSAGEFPRVSAEPCILGDQEKCQLAERGVELDGDCARKLLDESLIAYIGLTRATERLAVVRRTADDAGRPLGGSIFWRDLERFAADAPVLPQATSDASANQSARRTVESLLRWARDPSREVAHAAAIYHLAATGATLPPSLDRLLRQAWPALSYNNQAVLSDDIVRRLFGEQISASVTQIESFAACPYQHFTRSILKLRPRPEPEVTPLDVGNLFHGVLEQLVQQLIETDGGWQTLHQTEPSNIGAAADEISGRLRSRIMLSSARNKYLVGKVKAGTAEVLMHQHTAGAAGALRPHRVELSFGMNDAGLPPLQLITPRGRTLLLRGKIDRVDRTEDQQMVAVFDYKSRGDELSLAEVYHGLALQLLTYLLVLQSNGEEDFTYAVGAFYVKLLCSLDLVAHPADAREPGTTQFALRQKMRGVLDLDFAHLLDADLPNTGKSEAYFAQIKKDGEPHAKGDHCTHAQFTALLQHVGKQLRRIGDEIADGRIDIRPYRHGKSSPCANCDMRSICRFDPGINGYLHLPPLDRAGVLAILDAAEDE